MAYAKFPVEASVVSAEGLRRRVLSKYSLPRFQSCRFFAKGVNDTYTVQAGVDRYYLRVYSHGRVSKMAIDSEVDTLNYLEGQSLPVSHPVPKKDGKYITAIATPEGRRYAVLFTEAVGKPPKFNLAGCRQYGEIMAAIHQAMDQRPTDRRPSELGLHHLIDEPLKKVRVLFENRKDDFEYLLGIGAVLKTGVHGLLTKESPEYGYCHGDFHGANVHQDESGQMVVFDFDCGGYGWRAYDAAVFLWQLTIFLGWGRPGKIRTTRRWNAFVEGYGKIRSLTANELEATRLFVPIRNIWMLGLRTQLARTMPGALENGHYVGRNIRFIKQCVETYRV